MPRYEVHTTDRQQFKICRQRWDFQSGLRRNLEPRRPVEPLWFGSGVHQALAVYYDPSSPRSASEAVDAFKQYCHNWHSGLEAPSIEDDEWLREMLDLGLGVLDNYFGYAKEHDRFDVLWVERTFEVEIPGLPGVAYNFTTDGLVIDEFDRIWLLEHKTAAMLNHEEQQWLMMDDQVGSYIWALHQVDEVKALGRPIEGAMYNTLKKKRPVHLTELKNGGLSINKMQDTTYEIALQDCKNYYGTNEEGKVKVPPRMGQFLRYLRDEKPNNFVKRELVRRNQHEIEMIGKMMRYEVIEMINNPTIYRTPSRINCGHCPFVGPCLIKWEGGDYELALTGNYQKRTPRGGH